MLDVNVFFFEWTCNHLDLHVLTHSFPTRRSSNRPTSSSAAFYFTPCRAGSTASVTMACSPAHAARIISNARAACSTSRRHRPTNRPMMQSPGRSEEHTSELQSLMRLSYAVFCLTKKKIYKTNTAHIQFTIN